MGMVKMLRWAKGTVQFLAKGQEQDKFLRELSEEGVDVRNLHREDGGIAGELLSRDYRKLAQCARRTRVRLRHRKKKGLPFLLRRYRKRWGLVVGICIFTAFLGVSQCFVWEIRIAEGYGEKQEQYLLQVMADSGLYSGAYFPDLNLRSVRDEVLTQVDDLSWLSFTRKGTTVWVDWSRKTAVPEFDGDAPCNIVAQKPGQIVSVHALEGQKMVEPKAVVDAGDLVISGIRELQDGSVLYVHADGSVMAQTQTTHRIEFQLSQTERVETGKSCTRRWLSFLGLKIPLFIDFDLPGPSQSETTYYPAEFFGHGLPMGVFVQTHTFYQMKEVHYTEEQGKQLLLEAFHQYEREELSNAQILGFTESWSQEDGKLILERRYQCLEDIARKSPILLTEDQKELDGSVQ